MTTDLLNLDVVLFARLPSINLEEIQEPPYLEKVTNELPRRTGIAIVTDPSKVCVVPRPRVH